MIDDRFIRRLGRLSANPTAIVLAVGCLLLLSPSGCSTFSEHRSTIKGRWNQVRARTTYQVASQQFARGQLETAIETVHEAIATDATSSHAFLLLARCLVEQGKLVSARKAAEQALHRAPASAEIAYTLGVIAERAGQLDTALEHFRRAGTLDPNAADYLLAEAECLTALGRVDQAAELVAANIHRLDSDGTLEVLLAEISLLRGDRKTALANLKAAFVRGGFDPGQPDGPGRVKMLVEEYGRLLSEAGRHQEARAVLGPYVKAVPNAPTSAVTALCTSYLYTGRVAEATALLQREVRRNPSSVKSWTLLARASLMTDDWPTTRRCADRLEALSPESSLTHLLRAFVGWKQGDLRAAERSLKLALALDDSDEVAHELYGLVLEDAGRPRALVEAHFERARQLASSLEASVEMIGPVASTDAAADLALNERSSSTSPADGTRLP